MVEKDLRVLIGYVTGEYARRSDFYDRLMQMSNPPGSIILPAHNRSPAKGRNMLIGAALDLNCTHILFIDDDMAPRGDSLLKLLAHNKDIVTGLYVERIFPHKPLIFDHVEPDGRALHSYLEEGDRKLRKVANCGFGFVLIKTDVFRALTMPWVTLGDPDPEQWCDDINFFNKVTAEGFEIYCDMDCLIGHIGSMIIWPKRNDKGEWEVAYDTDGKASVSFPYEMGAKYEFTK